MRVGGFVVGAMAAHVDDGLDTVVLIEVFLDLILVGNPGVL